MSAHTDQLQDEDERIAVRALDAMRNSAKQPPSSQQPPTQTNRFAFPSPPSGATSTSHTPALSLSMASSHPGSSPPHTPPPEQDDLAMAEPAAGPSAPTYSSLARMQSLPLVSGALRVYEVGKANSRVVQYTSSLVSSSLRHASSHLPSGSGERMDELAGGMLDRLDWYRRGPAPSSTTPPTTNTPPSQRDAEMYSPGAESGSGSSSRGAGKRREMDGPVPTWLEATSPFVAPPPPPPSERGKQRQESNGEERQVAQRSRWQAMLLEAGGLSAALSDESMRRLRYCLQWLQYATQHIDAQILILRDFIASLQPAPPPTPPSSATITGATNFDSAAVPELTPDHLKTLAHLRSDIVHTIRQVVGVVSKYAGGALPEPARGRVRGFILDLPKKFGEGMSVDDGAGSASGVSSAGGSAAATRRGARRERGTGSSGGTDHSSPSSPIASAPSSPHFHLRPLNPSHAPYPTHSRRGSTASAGRVEAGRAMAAAQRVLTLATESLDMMRGVTAVVGESLDRADAWVDRLRTVGIQRGMDGLALPGPNAPGEHSPMEMWRGPGTGTGSAGTGTGTPSTRYGSGATSPGVFSAPSPGTGLNMGLGQMSLASGPGEFDDEEDVDAEGEELEDYPAVAHPAVAGKLKMEVDG
ncbi:hypothetical protein HMN09_01112100 [Mycena chlorophos]|uniref:Opi1-domain-containing protein n=1 Tax=Mycena chlorophos TaxID=658473 RepID=A0A8H6VZW3_MYCCL|nr:hypothetical protein HMN09_01112100 [Mycena chlorophos]